MRQAAMVQKFKNCKKCKFQKTLFCSTFRLDCNGVCLVFYCDEMMNTNKHTLTNEEITRYSRQLLVSDFGAKGK